MINLCLDTNVYLSFYHFSDNDLQKLEEILTLIEEGDLKIILPEQIKNEFLRNREVKISDALKKIKEKKMDFTLPKIVASYEETRKLLEIFKAYSKEKDALLEKVEKDINDKTLKADILIQKIFEKAEFIPLNEETREKAKMRYDLWNPPWKDKSYWDAIIWETLLGYKGKKVDIDFVSIDGDYCCPLNNENLNNFLQQEREDKREWKVLFYSSLNSFFETHFPGIKIDEEYLKNKYVDKFVNSRSFNGVRYNLARLIEFEDYSLEQIKRIIDWAITSGQIRRCVQYSPYVWEDIVKLVKPYFSKIDDFWRLMDFLEIYDYKLYSTIRSEYEAEFYPADPDETYEWESF